MGKINSIFKHSFTYLKLGLVSWLLILVFRSIGLGAIIPGDPYIVYGYVRYADSSIVVGADVTVKVGSLTHTDITDASGQYSVVSWVQNDGDPISVEAVLEAVLGAFMGISYATLSFSDPGGKQIDVTVTENDTTAPSPITDLSAINPKHTSALLTFTAPGDDGDSGDAAEYDIRYSTNPVTDSNWDLSIQFTGEPSPSTAGTFENITVTGLSSATTYYFAIKTADEVPNWSVISNTAGVVTQKTTLSIGHVSAANGQEINVPLLINNVIGAASVEVKLSYNPLVVLPVNVTNSDFDLPPQDPPINPELGYIIINAMQFAVGLDGTVKIADITLRAVGTEEESSSLILTDITLQDMAMLDIPVDEVDDGTFSIDDTIPDAPSGLSALSLDSSTISLSWTDNSDNETGFEIYRNLTDINWETEATLVYTTLVDVISYQDNGLNPSTLYYYRVKATNALGDSSWSSTAQATTPVDVIPPEVPVINYEDGAKVFKVVMLEVQVSDNEGVNKVEFYVDGVLQYTSSNEPYKWEWDTEDAQAGEHEIKVVVYDNNGNTNEKVITMEVLKASEAITYPNPFIKGKSSQEVITFHNLPKQAIIRIYTLRGDLVKKIEHDAVLAGGGEEWDINNVKSGKYLYMIISSQGTQKGKLCILK